MAVIIDEIKAELKSQVEDQEEGIRSQELETYFDCFGSVDNEKLQQVLDHDIEK